MMSSLSERQRLPPAGFQGIPYIIFTAHQAGEGGFQRRRNDAHKGYAMPLTGIHRLTAISARPRENLAFETSPAAPRVTAGARERPYRTGTNQLACFARAATKDYHLQAGAGAINDGTVRLKR
jgi:hypothetical protein